MTNPVSTPVVHTEGSTPLEESPERDSAGKKQAKKVLAWLVRSVPRGNCLSPESWERRHTAIVALLWAHVLALPWLGITTGHGISHSLLETAVVAVFALGATMKNVSAPARSVLATVGLITSSAILTHFFHGLIEMHFHFFIMVAVITLYQSWLPFAFAIGYVLVHHGLAGALDPSSVFNHPSAIAHPWKWAAIHALFITGESLACLTAWRLNELALEAERATRTELEKANRDLAEAQELASIGSWEWDIDSGRLRWSEELYRIFGFDPGNFTPTLEAFMELVHPDDQLHLSALLDSARDGAQGIQTDCRIVRKDGSMRVIRATGSRSHEVEPGVNRMVGTCQDVTEQKKLEEEIEYKAFHDPLTGLANRGLFRDRLAHALKRRSASGVAVLFIDLDDFKAVNDRLGHAIGDALLIQVSRTLESLVRTSDTIARLGGDEFAILIDDDGSHAALDVAKRIHKVFQRPVSFDAGEVTVRPSMGVAVAGEGTTPDDLLRDADIAMYAVKAENKGGFELCSPDMRQSVLRRLELKTELQRAIENEEFVLQFQPIVCLDDRKVIALEALVRWEHPHWGLVPPNDFIPLAEETGLIVPLGAWILQEATRQAKSLQEASNSEFIVNVNLSARQLREEDIVTVVQQALLASRLQPSDLTLEVTETVLMESMESSIAALGQLRDIGVKIAIDDFGTGYSSLSYLHRFPIDILKIDRAFVVGAVEGRDEEALAQAVIKLATALDLRTVAEGIETDEQLAKMIELGCNRGQGYFFARPMPFAQIHEWLVEHKTPTSLATSG